jgi:hypothetical protein
LQAMTDGGPNELTRERRSSLPVLHALVDGHGNAPVSGTFEGRAGFGGA